MKDYVVWHKPDHFPSGEMLQQTAYGLYEDENGKKIFVSRINIGDLEDSNDEKTIAGIEKYVFGEEIKKEIIRQFKERIAKGMNIHDALCGIKDNPADGIYFKGNKVIKVKYIYHKRGAIIFNSKADKEIITTDRSGREHRKAYINGGYACAEFNKSTGKFKRLIPLWEYEKIKDKPVPSDTERIYAGDILCRLMDKTFYVVYKMGVAGLFLRNVSETQGNDISTKGTYGFKLVPDRKTLTELKKK